MSSVDMSTASLSAAVSIKVLAMAKNQAEQQGLEMVQMIQQSVDPNLGRVLDVKA